jgi:succinate-semialdehyde dehydrogenase/glutarate-semialdehyde dehydrogenase
MTIDVSAPIPEPVHAISRGGDSCNRDLFQWLAEAHDIAPPERGTIPVHAPWTGAVLGAVPHCTVEDVRAAVERARAAQHAWAAMPFSDRARVFLRFHDLILARRDQILDLMQAETGKARRHALEEVLDCANVARYYAQHGARHLRTRRRRGAVLVLTRVWELQHPRGVVGIIAPWNYPLSLAIGDAIPALLAGNAVVVKPDLQTPFTALWGVDLLREAGLPADLMRVVTGPGPETGPQLIDQVNFVTFTGSTATGRVVARQAGGRLIGCSLELGGKNALVVLEDANLGRAVEGAIHACFANTGQLCISAERIFVHARIYDAFVERFAARARALRLGRLWALTWTWDRSPLCEDVRRLLRTLPTRWSEARGCWRAGGCGLTLVHSSSSPLCSRGSRRR